MSNLGQVCENPLFNKREVKKVIVKKVCSGE